VIMVEIVSSKKIREEKSSYGMLTITITKESRPFTITGVLDPESDETLTVSQAVAKGILDADKKTYKTEQGESLQISDAIHSGLVQVDYHEGEAHHEPEVVTKTYTVHGVVDYKKKSKISFADAMRDGILDRESGEYVNNVTGARLGTHEAIMKGFIKARICADPSKLDFNPENSIVIEKLASAKAKLFSAMKVMK